jgi:hypothetical protein
MNTNPKNPTMTVPQRLKGCPTGATHDALLLHHTQAEIAGALAKGEITMTTRNYANPRDFTVTWFYFNARYNS